MNRGELVAQAFEPAGSGDFPVARSWSTGLERSGTMNQGGEIVARACRPRCRAHGRDARATTRRFMGRPR